jgi:hypothetical protein
LRFRDFFLICFNSQLIVFALALCFRFAVPGSSSGSSNNNDGDEAADSDDNKSKKSKKSISSGSISNSDGADSGGLNQPLFAIWITIIVYSLMRGYAVAGDVSWSVVGLLPHCSIILPQLRRFYLLPWIFSLVCMMLPLTWFMWTGPGSGNANFFYNQTLFWLLCHFFMIVEVLGSVRRRHALRAVWQRQQQPQQQQQDIKKSQ